MNLNWHFYFKFQISLNIYQYGSHSSKKEVDFWFFLLDSFHEILIVRLNLINFNHIPYELVIFTFIVL